MHRILSRLLIALVLIELVLIAACSSNDNNVNANKAATAAKDGANKAPSSAAAVATAIASAVSSAANRAPTSVPAAATSAKSALSSLSSDGQRLAGQIQSSGAPDAKQQLLSQCQGALDRARQENVSNASQVDQLCNQIRDADPKNSQAWNDIKTKLNDLNK